MISYCLATALLVGLFSSGFSLIGYQRYNGGLARQAWSRVAGVS